MNFIIFYICIIIIIIFFYVGRERNALTKIREQHKVEDNI